MIGFVSVPLPHSKLSSASAAAVSKRSVSCQQGSAAPSQLRFGHFRGLLNVAKLPPTLRSVKSASAAFRNLSAGSRATSQGFHSFTPLKMVRKESTMLDLETDIIPFKLEDAISGETITVSKESLTKAGAKGLLVMFVCNHCPFVVHIRDKLVELCNEYVAKGIQVVAVNSNSIVTHPQDGPENMAKLGKDMAFAFPYVFDATQEVAKAYRAACTPDFYVFDAAGALAYRGQFDDARPSKDTPVTGASLRAALDDVLAGRKVVDMQRPSIGCNIKWTPGSEPDYF